MLNLWDAGVQSLDLPASLMETAPLPSHTKLHSRLSSAYILSVIVPWKCGLLSLCLPFVPGAIKILNSL